ncbi:ureidoglycolate lyase [Diplocloster hominis]|uniref:ureidoglycolate lyase n=1 Tax=Diplocloster hominis TaxID=3079010 RepID=UPI0031BB2C4E
MRKIKAKELTVEGFAPYGEFYNLVEPTGKNLGSFYHDHVLYHTSGRMPVAFSSLVVDKPEKYIVDSAEYHNYTGEVLLPLDDDVVIHVATPSKEPVPELTEAFLVPKGTVVKLNAAVWHLAPMALHNDKSHVLIVLPERVYYNDCYVVDYPEEDHIEIEL